ncbi:Glycosyltransferase involved in cell wall bisynthesis [Dyadobacter soli]|uniref:Glycosyltransferase involved in cell wall bisynthesis n=1 Tax=Dyadobacter soli TaxID=659014 RepID=A0A1G7D7V2_9BACT|nr:glycosyltransferase family 2 protein [Dyadobacter soli]SDE47587.1 Glycosyltransferase involved in cell wall bisynthesis [Dyadobacter soli]
MISIIIPVYKSASTLAALHKRISQVAASLPIACEIVYVNDASPDNSLAILRELPPDIAFHIINLKKNAGQSNALIVGMAFAHGELVATMDADLQDEPENLSTLINAMQPGIDVVFAKRQGQYESPGRLLTSYFFKGMVHWFSGRKVPMNAGLFMVLKKDAAVRFAPYLPYSPYLIGLIAKAGLKCAAVTVQRPGNAFGETSYTFKKRMRVAKSFFRTLRLPKMDPGPKPTEWLNSHLLADHSYIARKP